MPDVRFSTLERASATISVAALRSRRPRPARRPFQAPAAPEGAAERGVSAEALLARRGLSYSLSALDLERWLVEQGFATNGDGLLHPTERGREIGSALSFLG